MRGYTGKDLEISLRVIFSDRRVNRLMIDGPTLINSFSRASLNYGLRKGLLHRVEEEDIVVKGKFTIIVYRLTFLGESVLRY